MTEIQIKAMTCKRNTHTIDEALQWACDVANRVMEKEQQIRPTVTILHGENQTTFHVNQFLERKHGRMELVDFIKNFSKNKGCDAIISVAEAWMTSDVKEYQKARSIKDIQDKKEVVMVNVVWSDKSEKSAIFDIVEESGKRILKRYDSERCSTSSFLAEVFNVPKKMSAEEMINELTDLIGLANAKISLICESMTQNQFIDLKVLARHQTMFFGGMVKASLCIFERDQDMQKEYLSRVMDAILLTIVPLLEEYGLVMDINKPHTKDMN